jgi:hypothetical protein
MSRARAATAGRPSLAAQPARPPDPEPSPAPAPTAELPTAPAAADADPEPEPASPEPARDPVPAPGTSTAAAGRRTIQIGERPGPAKPAPVALQPDPGAPSLLEAWAPRIAAILALIVVVAVLVLLLS